MSPALNVFPFFVLFLPEYLLIELFNPVELAKIVDYFDTLSVSSLWESVKLEIHSGHSYVLIGNSIEIFFIKLSVMNGRAAFRLLRIINFYNFFFTIFFNDKFGTWRDLRPVRCDRDPRQ